MPKVKVPRKSTNIDMTAMCDVAFLLLTFFMLTTKFKPDEPVVVDTPSSISEIKLPESDIMNILIDKEGKVFFGIDGQNTRIEMLKKIGTKYNMTFTEGEEKAFSLISVFGVPMKNLKQYINLKPEDRAKFPTAGIPVDSLNNELSDWIWEGRKSNPGFRIAIKGDNDAKYPVVQKVIATLQDRNVNKFNFITSLEADPNRDK
jgi:biopolymer transport protein ExbD